MPTQESVETWLIANHLESNVWTDFERKSVAFVQAIRHLNSWYPDVEVTDEVVAYQVIWEIKGLDPVLKYSGLGVKSLTDNGERVDYGDFVRNKVAPEVHALLGLPIDEQEPPEEVVLYGGRLI